MKITSLDLPSLELELKEQREELPEGANITEVMKGFKYWDNPINHFRIIRLHRSADPAKRSKEWEDITKAGLGSSDWLREYELFWAALEGKPVYMDHWSHEFHSSRTPIGWSPNLVVARGWDFGLYPATIFVQLIVHERLMVLRELVGVDIDTERFVHEVSRLSNEWFPGATFYDFVDPTGAYRVGTDGRRYIQLLGASPLKARKILLGENAPAARKMAVIDFLKGNVRGLPIMSVDPSCEMLIKGFDGGYHYPYYKGTLKDSPDKNIFSHIHDALQYVCSKIRRTVLKSEYPIHFVEPSFSTQTKPPSWAVI